MARPLVSIVTPTIPGRERLLLERCMVSIFEQDYDGPIEQVIVSDENPSLRDRHSFFGWETIYANYRFRTQVNAGMGTGPDYWRRVRFVEINDLWKNEATRQANGCFPWMIGSYLALGDFVGFLGDDDELKPEHVTRHIDAMQAAGAMWSLSKVEFRAGGEFWNVIGDESYVEGHLDATGIMCYKDALRIANWNPAGRAACDWELVNSWRHNGLVGTFIDEVTGIHHDGWLTGKTGQPYD